jgi:heme/copper-type cytochrome/quinol oxidase subunit 3
MPASVTTLRPAHESRRTSFVGMVMALGSWTMLFASLFFSYAILRLRSPLWPPDGTAALPRLLPFVNTLVLLGSSVALHLGLGPRADERPGALLAALRRAVFLGSLFLALQFAVWIPLWRSGFRIDSGVYGSIFYGLTAFHALHVLCGLAALLWLVPKARRGVYTSSRQSAVRVTAMFWHFIDAVWVVLFVAVYLV